MDSRKPLTAGEIEELAHVNREIQDCGGVWLDYQASKIVNALPRLLSMLTPPPDAAVREAWCREQRGKPAAAPMLTDNQLREQMPDRVRCAVEFFRDDRNSYGSVTAMWGYGQAITLHISDLTRRLAEVEAENGRFAGMLEDSVSGWRKLYTEERAERVRIEGILLNDVQAERQESDEHINGLNVVIKTQDKTIRDLKSRVVELAADWQVQFAKAEAAEARVRELVAEAAKRPLASDDEQTIADLEAFKTRVMEWARGRCGACEHEGSEDDTCYNCQSDDEQSNWTPPQAWEVGE